MSPLTSADVVLDAHGDLEHFIDERLRHLEFIERSREELAHHSKLALGGALAEVGGGVRVRHAPAGVIVRPAKHLGEELLQHLDVGGFIAALEHLLGAIIAPQLADEVLHGRVHGAVAANALEQGGRGWGKIDFQGGLRLFWRMIIFG